MVKKHSREKQAEVLRRTQAKRKEHKKEQILKPTKKMPPITGEHFFITYKIVIYSTN